LNEGVDVVTPPSPLSDLLSDALKDATQKANSCSVRSLLRANWDEWNGALRSVHVRHKLCIVWRYDGRLRCFQASGYASYVCWQCGKDAAKTAALKAALELDA